MKTVLILCGGISSEHEVSLQSAVGVYQNISRKLYDPMLVGIKKDGTWCMGEDLILNATDPKRIQLSSLATSVSSITSALV